MSYCGTGLTTTLSLIALLAAAAFATASGCGGGDSGDQFRARSTTDADATAAPGDSGAPADDDGINTTGSGAGTGANTGLPCNVQQLLENRCIACHLSTTPYPLLTYENLLAPPPSDPKSTMADKSLARMKDTARPMPPAPAPAPAATEVDVFQAWVTAGKPRGAVCTDTPDGGVREAGAPIPNTPTVCTSKKTWKDGNEGSGSMRPGGACNTCHSQRGGPAYDVAGTVYPTLHEPNDCNGVAGALTVVVTDANGKVTNLTVNGAGNFHSKETRIPAPFTVKVTDGTKVRPMIGSLTAGDCNSCHTEKGANGAPGRIVAP